MKRRKTKRRKTKRREMKRRETKREGDEEEGDEEEGDEEEGDEEEEDEEEEDEEEEDEEEGDEERETKRGRKRRKMKRRKTKRRKMKRGRRREGDEEEEDEEEGDEEADRGDVGKTASKSGLALNGTSYWGKPRTARCVCVGWLLNVPATVSQGRICSDNFTYCHTEIEVADQTFYLTQSQYTDTEPTSPSADPITPGAWHGSPWSANF